MKKDSFDRLFKSQGVVERPSGGVLWKSEPAGCIALRVTIDNEGLLLFGGERGAEIYGGGCLANAALLVGNSYNSAQVVPSDKHYHCIRRIPGIKLFHAKRFNPEDVHEMFHVKQRQMMVLETITNFSPQ